MKHKLKYRIDVQEDGTPIFRNREAWLADMKEFAGQSVLAEFSKYVKQRSTAQNNVFHWYCGIVAEETGMTPQVVKDAMKAKFLTVEVTDSEGNVMHDHATGEVMTYVRDTSDLDKFDMYEFTENVRLFFIDWGIHLPLPDQNYKINFKQKSNQTWQ